MRALALVYPNDPAAVEREDTFLLGPDLLVAPVVEPGATEKTLYLPRGPLGGPLALRATAAPTRRCGCGGRSCCAAAAR